MERARPLTTVFYRTILGKEPVREWLQSLSKAEKFRIGVDIWKVQSEWPIGMPQVRPLGKGLFEVRSSLTGGIARVLFMIHGENLVLLHGLIKKTQKMPQDALELARKRKRDYEQYEKK